MQYSRLWRWGGLLGGFYWLFLGIRAGFDADATVGSPLSYLLFGLVTGLPLALPGGITAWSDARPEKAEARARKAKAATKHDRLEFAEHLVRQIKEFAEVPREVSASLTGEDGTVLLFKGDLERHGGTSSSPRCGVSYRVTASRGAPFVDGRA